MRLRLFFLVLLFLAVRPVFAVHCVETIPTTPLSLAAKLVDLGGGSFYFVGKINERDWLPTLIEFRKIHPELAVTDITARSHTSDACYNYLSDIMIRTTPIRKQVVPNTKLATLTISVSPWANVIWANSMHAEVSATRSLVLENIPCGKYTFRFESDAYEPVTRSVEVVYGKDVFLEVNLEEEAPTKTKLK